MSYEVLNQSSVCDYVAAREMMRSIFPKGSRLSAKEVGDGNLNQVFIVFGNDQPDRAVIVKQALPYLRVAGDSWPLTRERMRFETQALLLYNKVAPGLVPIVYDSDDVMSVAINEYLGRHEVMRKPLVARNRFPKFAGQISTFLAQSLFLTSDLHLPGIEKKALQAQFINPHLCKLQEDFVYTNPFIESPENKWNPLIDAEVKAVRSNATLKSAIAELKEDYMTRAQALLHGDLHTGSIMLNEDDMRVIDPEFAFCGPMGYDVGALLQNLILNYLSHFSHTPNADVRAEYQHYLLQMVRDVWNGFAAKFERLWIEQNRGELAPAKYWDFAGGADEFKNFRSRYIRNILRDASGHGGCKFLRRVMGIVGVWDITSIENAEHRARVERMVIRIGSRWILERQSVESIEDLIGIVREESQ